MAVEAKRIGEHWVDFGICVSGLSLMLNSKGDLTHEFVPTDCEVFTPEDAGYATRRDPDSAKILTSLNHSEAHEQHSIIHNRPAKFWGGHPPPSGTDQHEDPGRAG